MPVSAHIPKTLNWPTYCKEKIKRLSVTTAQMIHSGLKILNIWPNHSEIIACYRAWAQAGDQCRQSDALWADSERKSPRKQVNVNSCYQ